MGVQWRKENPNPRVHRSSGKLGEPRFPLERVDPRVGIFLSPLDTHDGFYLSHTGCTCVHVLFLNLGCTRNVVVKRTRKGDVRNVQFQNGGRDCRVFFFFFFQCKCYENQASPHLGMQEKGIYHARKVWIDKSVPRVSLASLG